MTKGIRTILILIGYDDDGEEVNRELPYTKEVCPRCEGHGTHLHTAIGEHAYTREEFEEAFSEDEDREAYFQRGGKYDVQCEECHGANVVDVPNYDALSPDDMKIYKKHLRDEADYRAECEAERLMGC